MPNVDGLLEYCTTWAQQRAIQTVAKCQTQAKAAKELGISERNVAYMLARVRKAAAKKGFSPQHDMTKSVPDGFHVKGVSTYYNEDGKPTGQWVKSQIDRAELESQIKEVIAALSEQVPKAVPVLGTNAPKDPDLLNLHVLTDYHLGMNAWGEETGENWDLKIAEDTLVRWFEYSIKAAPKAEVGILAQLGDFLHFDSLDPVTPVSRHLLDADTRFQKVVRVAIRSLRRIVHTMLKKYPHVHLLMADANHDPASSAWLREMFAAFYSDEPRITVDNSPDTYYCYEHGQTSLFFHHGHKRKPENIDDVFAAKFRDVFGRTRRSYAHMGHMHHHKALETNLMIVEQHRTMAAKDAYASSHGWMAGRGAATITYSKFYGEVGRQVVTPEMLVSEPLRCRVALP